MPPMMDIAHRPVLVVADDEPLALELLVDLLESEGYTVLPARDGEEAWSILTDPANAVDLLISDRQMPRLDGMGLLARIRQSAQLKGLRTMFVTGLDNEADIAEGIGAGVYYYLTKPYKPKVLRAVVAAALADIASHRLREEEIANSARAMSGLMSASFVCRTPIEARCLAHLLANASPRPQSTALGLTELMLNAVEHGNLGIGYEEKGQLMLEGMLDQEIGRRLVLPEYRPRQVRVDFERRPTGVNYLVRDEGKGFDPTRFLTLEPERATDWHGRGIALARMTSFDHVEYRGCGNEVLARVDHSVDTGGR